MNRKKVFISIIFVVVIVAIAGFLVMKGSGETSESSESPSEINPPHYEIIGTVTHLADGDTVTIIVNNIVADLDPAAEIQENTPETVRFGGGIDAPETGGNGEKGGENSTYFVSTFLYQGVKVYLDLDNKAVGGVEERPYRGTYGRLIALVYTKFNDYWINVNAQLLRWGMREFPGNDWDEYTYIDSEFSMYNWPPYDNDYPYVYPDKIEI